MWLKKRIQCPNLNWVNANILCRYGLVACMGWLDGSAISDICAYCCAEDPLKILRAFTSLLSSAVACVFSNLHQFVKYCTLRSSVWLNYFWRKVQVFLQLIECRAINVFSLLLFCVIVCCFAKHLVLQNFWSSRQKAYFFMPLKINMWCLLGDAEVTESLQRKHFAVLLGF